MTDSRKKKYEKELPEGYRRALYINAKEPKFGIIFNLIALAVLIIVMALAIIILNFRGELSFKIFAQDTPNMIISYLVFIGGMVGYIILHELVHGISYKLLTGQKLTFGISWSCAFCGVPNIYTYKKTALISVIAPFVLFTLLFIPALIISLAISPLYFLIFAFLFGLHAGGCSGDIYVFYLLSVKFKGKTVLMRDTGPEQFFYAKD